MKYTLKKILYSIYLLVSKAFYRCMGRRIIVAFGEQLKTTPDTIFPDFYHFKIPKQPYPARIVQYTDFVQMNAICAYLMKVSNGGVVIDVGAHHGAYAILCGKLLQKKGGKVIAIEPNPDSYEILTKNIRLNALEGTVIPLLAGVYDKEGKMSVSNHGSESQLRIHHKKIDNFVDVYTLGMIFQKYQITDVDLLIIDVEGAELPVLQGYPWNGVPVNKIFCELHPYAWLDFSYTANDFSEFLSKHSLKCFDMYFQEHQLVHQQGYIGPCMIIPV